jgi:hypothetical protein
VRGEEATFDRLLTTVYYSLLVYIPVALVIGLLSALAVLGRQDIDQFLDGRSPRSVGVWISADEIVALEQYALSDEEQQQLESRDAV